MKQEKGVAEAERAVAAIEAVQLGETFDAERTAALRAVEALRDAALDQLKIGQVVPLGADLAADLEEYLMDGAPRVGFLEHAVAIHGAALPTHPKLAEALRSFAVVRRVERVVGAAVWVPNSPTPSPTGTFPPAGSYRTFQAEAERAAGVKYRQLIAAQLAARGELLPYSEIAGIVAPALAGRLAGAVQKHEAHVESERARLEATERAARDIQEKVVKDDLIVYFEKRRNVVVGEATDGRALDGDTIANMLRQGQMEVARAAQIKDDYVAAAKRAYQRAEG